MMLPVYKGEAIGLRRALGLIWYRIIGEILIRSGYIHVNK
jgi:hypothetical protein